jgi:hypothetical protein
MNNSGERERDCRDDTHLLPGTVMPPCIRNDIRARGRRSGASSKEQSMSEHDQDATIGVLTKRYSDARKARTALVATTNTIRHALDRFSRQLATVDGFNPSSKSIPHVPADHPSDAHIAAVLDELRAVCLELELTQRLLKEAGVDIP